MKFAGRIRSMNETTDEHLMNTAKTRIGVHLWFQNCVAWNGEPVSCNSGNSWPAFLCISVPLWLTDRQGWEPKVRSCHGATEAQLRNPASWPLWPAHILTVYGTSCPKGP